MYKGERRVRTLPEGTGEGFKPGDNIFELDLEVYE